MRFANPGGENKILYKRKRSRTGEEEDVRVLVFGDLVRTFTRLHAQEGDDVVDGLCGITYSKRKVFYTKFIVGLKRSDQITYNNTSSAASQIKKQFKFSEKQ